RLAVGRGAEPAAHRRRPVRRRGHSHGSSELKMPAVVHAALAPESGRSEGAMRCCPSCSAEQPIPPGECLWPSSWRCPTCRHGVAQPEGFAQLAPELDHGDDGFDHENFCLLAAAEERSFWFESRNQLIRWLVQCHAPEATRVLEIGCG